MMEWIRAFLKRTKLDRLINAETISYGVWGVVTTLLNVGSYRLLLFSGLDYKASNLIALILAKAAAFFANKYFVFHSRSSSAKALFREVFRYIYTRGFTMLIDYFGLILLVDVLGGSEKHMKYVTTLVVVIINYLFGKFLVFRKDGTANDLKEADE